MIPRHLQLPHDIWAPRQTLYFIATGFAFGCVFYFWLSFEPGWRLPLAVSAVAVIFICVFRNFGSGWLVLLAFLAGVSVASVHTHARWEPKLPFNYHGTVYGAVEHLDQSQSGNLRLTLIDARLADLERPLGLKRVRVSLRKEDQTHPVQLGDHVMLIAFLGPPSGPTEPGGYDFRLRAWFDGIGAVGYSRAPLLHWERPTEAISWIVHARDIVATKAKEAMRDDTSAIAIALITGNRSEISETVEEELRHAGLSHLLAISGMHMGMLASLVFFALKWPLSLIIIRNPGARVVPASALASVLVAGAYLIFSGASISTQRAFIMVAVICFGILLKRGAFSLNSVALAALIVLVISPDTVLSAGFQMSFAASAALISGFYVAAPKIGRFPRGTRWLVSSTFSAAIAGSATGPVAAFHFNLVVHYGLIANVIAVPIVGVLVMPGAALAMLGMPFGGEGLGFWVMDMGLRCVLYVARTVSSWPEATRGIAMPGAVVLCAYTFGLTLICASGIAARLAGLAAIIGCVALWSAHTRPVVLVSQSGRLVGVLTESGRDLSSEKSEQFVAQSWLENDGDQTEQKDATGRGAFMFDPERYLRSAVIDGHKIGHITGQQRFLRLESCYQNEIIITNATKGDFDLNCRVYDATELSQTGALAISVKNGELSITEANTKAQSRPWGERQSDDQ